MRAKVAGAFAIGFAVGILCLAAGLWASGRLSKRSPSAKSLPRVTLPAPPGLPDLSVVKPPPQHVEIPSDSAVPAAPPHRGEASRVAPEPHLAMPIEDIDPNTLPDTFHEMRGDHPHEALDIMAPRGTPVHAVAEGNVVRLFTSKDGGLTVYQFDDTRNWCYYYAHLDRYAQGLKQGTLLRTGDVLGYVGSTGDADASAPHLHFAVFRLGPEKQWWKGTAVDPLPLLKEATE